VVRFLRLALREGLVAIPLELPLLLLELLLQQLVGRRKTLAISCGNLGRT